MSPGQVGGIGQAIGVQGGSDLGNLSGGGNARDLGFAAR